MSWGIKEQVPAFEVPDFELAIEFYSRLGFRVEWKWPKAVPTHLGMRHGPCALMLTLGEATERGEIYYVVDDVRGCFKSIMDARPWEVAPTCMAPDVPTLKAHGHEDFSLKDPWGHQLTFGREETE